MTRSVGCLLTLLAVTTATAAMAAPPADPPLRLGVLWPGVPEVPPSVPPMSADGSDGPMVHVSGRLFYEDHRRAGLPERRQDIFGQPGVYKPDRDSRVQRFLGATWMTVDVYERDQVRGAVPGCTPLAWVGAAIVGPDGAFSLDVPSSDPCSAESAESPQYVVRVQTRYCTSELCFEVGRERDAPYTLWFGVRSPLTVEEGAVGLGDLLFSPARRASQNNWSRAANHYASLVEVIDALHVERDIPFRMDAFGPLLVRFPSRYSSGRATRYDLIDANNSGWPKGGLMIHEYGHIVHRRAWGGDYAGFHDPIQAWSGKDHSAEEPFIAFKEGWANFLGRYLSGRCDRARYDRRANLTSVSRGRSGNRYPENHHRALCDWVDDADDRREGVVGEGDVMSESLYALWQAIDRADDQRWSYASHDPVREGLDFCDVMTAFVMLEKSPERVGLEAHRRYTWQVVSLLENNDITCATLPTPASMLEHDLALSVQPAPQSPGGPSRYRQEVVIRNVHAFMPSPPAVLRIQGDGEVLEAAIPRLSAGAEHAVLIERAWPAHPVSMSATLEEPSGLDLDPRSDRVDWVVPAEARTEGMR